MVLLFGTITKLIEKVILKFAYLGIVMAMAIESACIPLPSEVIMPFSGFLVARGELDFWFVSLAGAIGCLLGSTVAWWVGRRFGERSVRQLIRRFGKFVLVFEYELDEAIDWFNKHGEIIIFTSRLLPVVRTFISLPAGILEMSYLRFAFYTTVGSFLWSAGLAFVGLKLGENWEVIGQYFHKFDFLLVSLLVLLGVWYFYHKIKRHRRWKKREKKEELD